MISQQGTALAVSQPKKNKNHTTGEERINVKYSSKVLQEIQAVKK